MAKPRDAMITGIGLVSCLGEGIDAHWDALNREGGLQPVVDATTYAGWSGPLTLGVAIDSGVLETTQSGDLLFAYVDVGGAQPTAGPGFDSWGTAAADLVEYMTLGAPGAAAAIAK